MKLHDFMRLSVLPQMQVTSLYFEPGIPRDKLSNAVREYAAKVDVSNVVALIDETFWGNAKEGMLITNEELILSKKLGGHVIPFSSIIKIEVREKNLIINDLPLAKFNNPEVMPLTALGNALNNFVSATRKSVIGRNTAALGVPTIEKMSAFLARITEPLYFENALTAQREAFTTTTGYVLAENLTYDQQQLLHFKGGFASNEKILCASWLESHSAKDYFFCVTNHGIYSISPDKSEVFISHDHLRVLEVAEEYKESRYVGIRLSNNQKLIVSIQNSIIRPYAHELLSGLINILNDFEPASRLHDKPQQHEATSVQQQPSLRFQPKDESLTNRAPREIEQTRSQHIERSIPLRVHDSDRLFDAITQINSIDNIGNFIGSMLSESENANSNIRKKFQSYVVRSTRSFRAEIVENGGFAQFKNDVATMEICGAVMAIAFNQMQDRGVDNNIAARILFEGIRSTFSLKASAQSEPTGAALIKIVESYIPDEDGDEGLDDLFFNFIIRLIGSNLSGRLCPDYTDTVEEYVHLLESFVPTLDPWFSKFLDKTMSESRLLIDNVLNVRW